MLSETRTVAHSAPAEGEAALGEFWVGFPEQTGAAVELLLSLFLRCVLFSVRMRLSVIWAAALAAAGLAEG